MAKKKKAPDAPKGLKLIRTSGTTFRAYWTKGDKYTKQQIRWRKENPKGKKADWSSWETATGTSESHEFSATGKWKYIKYAYCEIKGKDGKDTAKYKIEGWSSVSDKKSHAVLAPKKPTLTVELLYVNQCKFTWDIVEDRNHDRPISKAIVETALVQDCDDKLTNIKDNEFEKVLRNGEPDERKSGSWTKTEDTSVIADGSWTRVVRVREVGLGGKSKWIYQKHVYAEPEVATNLKAVVTKTTASLDCVASWSMVIDKKRPIDKVIPQWRIDVPLEGMECPDDDSWNDLPDMAPSENMEKRFALSQTISTDKCMFFRVVAIRDGVEQPCTPILASGDDAVGALATPTLESIDPHPTTITIEATNNSQVEDSFLVDYLETEDGLTVLGVHDTDPKTYTVSIPTNVRVGVQAFVGEWDSDIGAVIEPAIMESVISWSSGNIPIPPSDFKLAQSSVANTVNVTWEWEWDDADGAEISWSTEPDGWISSDEPDSSIMLRSRGSQFAIKGVDTGVPLYVRIRFIDGYDEDAIYSTYSIMKHIVISAVPPVPVMNIEKDVYLENEDVTVSWDYTTTDGTYQTQAVVYEHTVVNNNDVYTPINGNTLGEEKTFTFPHSWEAGTDHYITVQVINNNGDASDMSNEVIAKVAEPVTCEISDTNLEIVSDKYELHELPLTVEVTATGAINADKTIIAILRKGSFKAENPSGAEDFRGFDGDVIFQNVGDSELDISGIKLDDGADYVLHVSAEDDMGQSKDDEIPFTVNFDDKPVKPTATVTIEDTAAVIEIGEPDGAPTGATVDIYRLSVDSVAELIYENAELGGKYVDPYPAIGDFGYRLVMKNAYGGVIVGSGEYAGQYAWDDFPVEFHSDRTLIDFGSDQIGLRYNVDTNWTWDKDVKKVKYLGGSIVGYYVQGVDRSGSASAVRIPILEADSVPEIRKLAEYQHDCHIRTLDGSSFNCAISVSEDNSHDKRGTMSNVSLSIERTNATELDGMTYADWSA